MKSTTYYAIALAFGLCAVFSQGKVAVDPEDQAEVQEQQREAKAEAAERAAEAQAEAAEAKGRGCRTPSRGPGGSRRSQG